MSITISVFVSPEYLRCSLRIWPSLVFEEVPGLEISLPRLFGGEEVWHILEWSDPFIGSWAGSVEVTEAGMGEFLAYARGVALTGCTAMADVA